MSATYPLVSISMRAAVKSSKSPDEVSNIDSGDHDSSRGPTGYRGYASIRQKVDLQVKRSGWMGKIEIKIPTELPILPILFFSSIERLSFILSDPFLPMIKSPSCSKLISHLTLLPSPHFPLSIYLSI